MFLLISLLTGLACGCSGMAFARRVTRGVPLEAASSPLGTSVLFVQINTKQENIVVHPPKPQQLWEGERRRLGHMHMPSLECRKAENSLTDSQLNYLLCLGLQCCLSLAASCACLLLCRSRGVCVPLGCGATVGTSLTVHAFHAWLCKRKCQGRLISKLYWHSPDFQGFLCLCYLPQPPKTFQHHHVKAMKQAWFQW